MNLDRRHACALAFAGLLTLPVSACAQPAPLKFGVGMFQPDREKNDATYRPLATDLSQRLGRPVALRTVDSWEGLAKSLANGAADPALMGPWGCVLANHDSGAQVVSTILYQGRPEYFAMIATHSDSGLASIDDLRGAKGKGRSFTFGDQGSTSGPLIPPHAFQKRGIDPDRHFAHVLHTKHQAVQTQMTAGQLGAGGLGLLISEAVGLYGNARALERVLELFDAERGRKRLVFNGDFHWFDVDPDAFARVQRAVLAHEALRGNVETEVAAPASDADAGCGCACPDWVGDGVVERSNRILARLRRAATPAQQAELEALPMWLRVDVGPMRLGLVHGDATALAGWGFAQEHLRDEAHCREVRGWFDRARVDAFACTHTCLPIFQALAGGPGAAPRWVFNNGAAGMPNFAGDRAGLLTRVARSPFRGKARRFGIVAASGAVHVDGIAIAFDAPAWLDRFVQDWPMGSDAHASSFDRIARGPAYGLPDVVRAGAGCPAA